MKNCSWWVAALALFPSQTAVAQSRPTAVLKKAAVVCRSLPSVERASALAFQGDFLAFETLLNRFKIAGECAVVAEEQPVFVMRRQGDYALVRTPGDPDENWVHAINFKRPTP